jgi:hypothetical protein
LISPDLKNVVLVDDQMNFIKRSGSSGIDLQKTYLHFDTYEEVVEARKLAKTAEARSWIPETQGEWVRDRNRFKKIQSILDEALQSADPEGGLASRVDKLNQLRVDRSRLRKPGSSCIERILGAVL